MNNFNDNFNDFANSFTNDNQFDNKPQDNAFYNNFDDFNQTNEIYNNQSNLNNTFEANSFNSPQTTQPTQPVKPAQAKKNNSGYLTQEEYIAREDKIDLTIYELLGAVVQQNASDLHIIPKHAIGLRVDGEMKTLKLPGFEDGIFFSAKTMKILLKELITDEEEKMLIDNKEYDFSIERELIVQEEQRDKNGLILKEEKKESVRFRANYYYVDSTGLNVGTEGAWAAAFRIIPKEIKSLDMLSAPEVFKDIVKRERGLILVTGPTGSGKSTTLAAMLNEVNERERKHIVTIEHPVEFVHPHKQCMISYRGVDIDTHSFGNAIRGAMRQDPDIILIGEMRDKETISAAITAAETGHLVFATLHTNSAPQTINRIVESFGGDEQAQIRAMLSNSLAAIISQSLVKKEGGGRIAVHEILINNSAIANLIRENKIEQIVNAMSTNQQETKMQIQTQTLAKLVREGKISYETALQYANNRKSLIKDLEEDL